MDSRELGLKSALSSQWIFLGTADIGAITEIAHTEGMKVLVDGAQSFGATSKGAELGRWVMPRQLAFPAKPLGCYGDGVPSSQITTGTQS